MGILRLPGMVAAALGDRTLIMVFRALGGLHALMGAVAVSELAAMIPETGGVFLGACIPVYLWLARDRRLRAGVSAAQGPGTAGI